MSALKFSYAFCSVANGSTIYSGDYVIDEGPETRDVAVIDGTRPDAVQIARLFASAPDLFEFAKTMRAYFEANPNGYDGLREACFAALAKAERGEE